MVHLNTCQPRLCFSFYDEPAVVEVDVCERQRAACAVAPPAHMRSNLMLFMYAFLLVTTEAPPQQAQKLCSEGLASMVSALCSDGRPVRCAARSMKLAVVAKRVQRCRCF